VFLRNTKITKNGKTHTYWRLVRSVRVGGKVRQETVAQLGDLTVAGRRRAEALARRFLGKDRGQGELFEDHTEQPIAEVKIAEVRVENQRDFGGAWLAWTLWRALELDRFCEEAMPQGKEEVPWAQVAAILVLARFCEPSSELHIAEHWYRRSGATDLFGVPLPSVQ